MPNNLNDTYKALLGVTPVGNMTALPAMATVQTIPVPDEANLLLLQIDAQAVRLTFDGTNPTPSFGWLFRATTTNTTNRTWIMVPMGTTAIKLLETAASATGIYQFFKTIRTPSWG